MSLNPEQHAAGLDLTAGDVQRATDEAFRELMERIRRGETPRAALSAISARWRDDVVEVMTESLGRVLQTAVSGKDVAKLPVRGVTLSKALYDQTRDVDASVSRIIKEHGEAFGNVRDLAKKIYEGYQFKTDGDPLAVNARLPKYLRDAFELDPGLERDLARVLARVQTAQLKTPALKAAYTQALDALEKGKGEEALRHKLDVAFYERNRYYANRIAQTETHRVHSERIAGEIMGDEDVGFVQVRLSSTHPVEDVCDYHARLDAYGQGPGVYPKEFAPRPPFHPHCRCVLVPRTDIDPETVERFDPGAAGRFFRDMDETRATKIAGSKGKLNAILEGRDPVGVFDSGKLDQYRTFFVGESSPLGPVLTPAQGVEIIGEAGKPKRTRKPKVPPVKAPEPWTKVYKDPEALAWFDVAFADAPAAMKAATARFGPVTLKQTTLDEKFYNPAFEFVEMNGGKRTDLRARGTWAHEFGHYYDHKAGAAATGRPHAFLSAQPEWKAAIKADADDLVDSFGYGWGAKAQDVRLARIKAFEKAGEEVLNELDDDAFVAIARRNLTEAGIDPDDFVRFMGKHTNFSKKETDISKWVAANRVAAAWKIGDAEGVIRALTDWDYARGYSTNTDDHFRAGMMGKLSDLIGATTTNRVCNHDHGFYGHSTAVYTQWEAGASTEVFANLFTAYTDGGAFPRAFAEKFVPRASTLFKKEVGL